MKLQLNELGILFIILVFFKLAGLINYGWLFVTIPIWVLVILGILEWTKKKK